MVTVVGWAGNEPVNQETTSTVKEQVPRMKTTTLSPQRTLEQAIEVFVGDLEGLAGALLKFEEALRALPELEEGALKERAPEHQNGQNLRLLSPSEGEVSPLS